MANQKKKILIIEDDEFVRKLYREQLVRQGYDFVEAVDGVEGIEKVRSEHPDFILLDLMLPKKNGFEVLADIKQDPAITSIPIFVLSNLGQQSDVQAALSMGVDDYIVKSDFRLSDVVEKISKRLSA
jgi:CheY-like chemotaxis protein